MAIIAHWAHPVAHFRTRRYWKRQASSEELLTVAHQVEASAWACQKHAGIDLVGVDGTLYDQMLDTIAMLGVIPKRFASQVRLWTFR